MPSSPPQIVPSEVDAVTMPMGRAQLFSFLLVLPCALVSVVPHWYLWDLPTANPFPLWMAPALVGGIVLHEALHGLGFYAGGASRAEIEFGFNWSGLAPYAHCSVPLRATPYRIAVALPGVVLGVVPLIVGLSVGLWAWTFFAFVMLLGAAGDALLLWLLRSVNGDVWVKDHPDEMGGLVLDHADAPVAPVVVDEDEPRPDGHDA